MERNQVLAEIRRGGVIPILRTATADDARALTEALLEAGVTTVEIPLTVPGALEVIADLARRLGARLLIGAGTVLDAASAQRCVDAGARFIISPGIDMETIAWCKRAGVAVLPGALTPTEILAAWKAGADMVKVFPASAVGGAGYLRAVKAPLPQIELVPTGGVSLETVASFIRAGAAAVGVGGDLVDVAALREGRAAVLGQRARRYLELVAEARVT